MTPAEILRALVAIPTPSAASNLPLLQWVAEFLEPKGWRVELFPYTDDNGVAKANLVARPGATPRDAWIDLAFVCHTDTVPYAPDWTNALQLHSPDGRLLHGCGACDVKGALACFLAAIARPEPTQVLPGAALILTADEEIGCKGMDRLLAVTNLRIRSAIVSEPTSLRPGIAGKGYGLARITVHGVEAHSAYPGEGLSAISLAAHLIAQIESAAGHANANPTDAFDQLFDPPRTTVNIGVIQGGSAKNIIPGACSFLVEWRPLPADPPQAMLARLQSLAAASIRDEPRACVQVEPLRAEPGFAAASDGPLQRRLQKLASSTHVPARKPVGISFGSEATRVGRIADEVIVIGPGDMHTAHSDRECVPLAELEEWTGTLLALLKA